MSKLRDIINGVAVDGANTFGADLKGIEPVTPNTAEVRIKALILEMIGETTLEKAKGHYSQKYPCNTENYGRDKLIRELRQKVKEL